VIFILKFPQLRQEMEAVKQNQLVKEGEIKILKARVCKIKLK
jgi:hypothetical protein